MNTSGTPDPEARHAQESVRAKLFGRTPQPVRIGRFTVLQRIGEGGMGVVLAARDPELDRNVAIKLIHPQNSANPTVRKRLLREAKALARLSDPHVVQVYEVGEHDGQLYIAMELLEGETLGEWLRADPPRPWPAVVGMFIEIGKGLAAAHAAGLVHRDFKPANVLIAQDGRPRVLDFGLARVELSVTDDSSEDTQASIHASASGPALDQPVTATGTLAGTPAYMAPEQFERRTTDARTDQFAYCVALWEAMYGEPPFCRDSLGRLAADVAAGVLQPPPAQRRRPVWLKETLERGLSVDPEARWASLPDLLARLRSGLGRGRRRRIWGLSISAVVALSLSMTVALQGDAPCTGAAESMVDVWDEATRAKVEQALLDTGVSYAAETWTRVERRLTTYAADWVAMHTEACTTAQRGEQSAQTLDRRMLCLDRRLMAVSANVRALERIDPRGVYNAANMVAGLRSLADCADVEALARADPLRPPDDLAPEVTSMEQRLVAIEAAEALGHIRPALADARTLLTDAETVGFAPITARIRFATGLLLEAVGEYEEATTAFERARLAALKVGDQPLVFRALDRLVFNRGLVLGDVDVALELAEVALATAQGMGEGASVSVAFLHDHVGAVLRQKGDYEGALQRHRKALQMLHELLPPDDRHIAVVEVNLGVIAFDMGRHNEAIEFYEAGLATLTASVGASHPDVSVTHSNLGAALGAMGRHEEALKHFNTALTISVDALGEDHPDTALARSDMGRILSDMGRHDEALAFQLAALDSRKRTLPSGHTDLAIGHTQTALTLRRLGRYGEALEHSEAALAIRREAQGDEHAKTAMAYIGVADSLLAAGMFARAVAAYEIALPVTRKARGQDHRSVGEVFEGIGMARLGQGRAPEAVVALERALQQLTAVGPDTDTTEQASLGSSDLVAETKFALARALWEAQGDRVRARELAGDARATWADGAGHRKDELAQLDTWLDTHRTVATAPERASRPRSTAPPR